MCVIQYGFVYCILQPNVTEIFPEEVIFTDLGYVIQDPGYGSDVLL